MPAGTDPLTLPEYWQVRDNELVALLNGTRRRVAEQTEQAIYYNTINPSFLAVAVNNYNTTQAALGSSGTSSKHGDLRELQRQGDIPGSNFWVWATKAASATVSTIDVAWSWWQIVDAWNAGARSGLAPITTLVGLTIEVYSGTGSGQFRTIESQAGSTLGVNPDWGTTPDGTSWFRIHPSDLNHHPQYADTRTAQNVAGDKTFHGVLNTKGLLAVPDLDTAVTPQSLQGALRLELVAGVATDIEGSIDGTNWISLTEGGSKIVQVKAISVGGDNNEFDVEEVDAEGNLEGTEFTAHSRYDFAYQIGETTTSQKDHAGNEMLGWPQPKPVKVTAHVAATKSYTVKIFDDSAGTALGTGFTAYTTANDKFAVDDIAVASMTKAGNWILDEAGVVAAVVSKFVRITARTSSTQYTVDRVDKAGTLEGSTFTAYGRFADMYQIGDYAMCREDHNGNQVLDWPSSRPVKIVSGSGTTFTVVCVDGTGTTYGSNFTARSLKSGGFLAGHFADCQMDKLGNWVLTQKHYAFWKA